jgi:hypothetical protein
MAMVSRLRSRLPAEASQKGLARTMANFYNTASSFLGGISKNSISVAKTGDYRGMAPQKERCGRPNPF